MNVKACPDDKHLAAHLLGRLHGARAEQLDSHLQVCDSCIERASKLRPKDKLTAALGGGMVGLSGDESVVLEIMEKAGALHSIVETSTGYETSSGQPNSAHSSANDIGFLSPPEESDEIGRLGHYRVLEVLGTGGMGVVFRAEDARLKRQVALKAMKPEIAATASAKERFLREARATAAIEHDNIVTIHQVDEEGGIPFLAMRFLRGESLQTRLKREYKLSIPEVMRIGREVASGLAAAHACGLIHRDIKPDNIWIESRHPQPPGEDRSEGPSPQTFPTGSGSMDRVKIVDFGLARADDDINLTKTGTVMGTPRYMSPEQAQGQTVDYRSDLFSLGAVLYHLTTGEGPFDRGSLTATLLAVMNDDPDRIESHRDGVPTQLAELIWQLLEKDPDERPQSADAVVEAIAEIEQQPALKSKVKPPSRELPKKSGNHTWRRVLTGISVVVPLLVVFGVVLRIRTPDGTLRVEVNDETLEVLVDGDAITMNDKAWEGKKKARKHSLSLKLNGKEIPFDEQSQTFVADNGRLSVQLGDIELKAKQFEVSRSGMTVLRVGFVPDEASIAIVPSESKPDETDKREEPSISPTATNPQLVAQFEHDAGKTKSSYFASLSPDGMRVAHRMAYTAPMQMIDVRTHHAISLPKEMQFALAMDHNADGTLFATGHPDGTVRVWNSQTLAQVGQPFVTKSGEQVRWVSLSGDGARLLALTNEKPPMLYAWYAMSREKIVDPFPLKDFSLKTKEIRLAATSDGRSFAIASSASAIPKFERRADEPDQVDESQTLIQLWDVERARALDTKFLPSDGEFGVINGLDISPRGDRLALACKRGQSYVYDTANGKELWSAAYGGRVISVRFSPDGRQLACCGGSADSEDLHLWDAEKGKELVRWRVPADEESGRTEWFGAWASKLAFSSDGSRLMTAGINTPVCVWSLLPNQSASPDVQLVENKHIVKELNPNRAAQEHEDADAGTIRRIAQLFIDLGCSVRLENSSKYVYRLPPDEIRVRGIACYEDSRVKDEHIPLLAQLPELEDLYFYACPVTDEGYSALANLNSLRFIQFKYSSLGDKGLAALASLKQLDQLALLHTDVTDDGLKSLGQMPALTRLTLSNAYKTKKTDAHGPVFVTDEGLAHLASIENLRNLWVMGPDWTDRAAEHLGALRQLKELKLTSPKITDAAIPHLGALPNLRRITLSTSQVSDKAMAELRKRLPRECRIDDYRGEPDIHDESFSPDAPLETEGTGKSTQVERISNEWRPARPDWQRT